VTSTTGASALVEYQENKAYKENPEEWWGLVEGKFRSLWALMINCNL
jgi:hypothetical protein